jgi:hypothetical protein
MNTKSEKRTCQNCKKNFVIEQEDFNFYEKIKVPLPTFCPECRTVRRLCWRNEMSLFKRKCSAPDHDEMLISIYHPDENLVVYDYKYWWSDEWDPLSYGKEYNFSKPFFLQWKELRDVFPLQCLSNSKATNSDYCNVAEESKDSYMCSGSWKIERSFYSNRITDVKDCSDIKEKFKKLYLNSIHRFANQIKIVNSTGDNIQGVKNCKVCFDANGGRIEDNK